MNYRSYIAADYLPAVGRIREGRFGAKRKNGRMSVGNRRNVRGVDADLGTPGRRRHTRFKLALEMSYSVGYCTREVQKRTGQTIDVSSSGLRFMAADQLPVGQRLLIAIAWPVRLDGGAALQLLIKGLVVRSSGTETAVRLEGYVFKTRGTGSKLVSMPGTNHESCY